MTIDKTWITLRDRNDPVFIEGIQKFMEIAKNHLDTDGKTYCPCKKCVNSKRHIPSFISAHIRDYGFLQSYDTWVYHGEEYPDSSEIDAFFASNTHTPLVHHEMFDAITDVLAEQNTHDENIEEDEDGTHLDPEFVALFSEVKTELFPGCSWMSSLNFIAKLMHIKVINKWTNTSFDQLLEFLRIVLPKENHVPPSYYEAKKKLTKIGLGYQSIHVCKHDCALFWKENESKENCPVCNESRWVDPNTNGKKVPHKVLRYFPLTSRLRRRYSSRFTAKDMIWHSTGRSTDGMMRHPVDGKEWQEFDKRYPVFSNEPRNVRLGLAADGFNPFGVQSQSYSMWPVVLTTYNTPPWLCMKESSFMLTLLIPGEKSPGKDIDVFLRPVVDELKMLWAEGVQVKDASTDTLFTMHAALLWTINDFPARSSLSGWSGQGYKACPICNLDTPSCRINNKIAYVGHRRFLPTKHKLRNSLLFNGEKEKRNPPRRLTNAQILQQLDSLPDRVPGKHKSYGGVKRKRAPSELNWTKRSIFYELEYWSSLKLKHNLDVMHIEKNVCESLLGTLLMNDKSKDTHKAREDLKNMGIRKDQWLTTKHNKVYQPNADYSFKPSDRVRFCKFIGGVRLPDGFGSNFKNKVVDTNIIGLKSHDHHVLMQRLLPIGVRAGLPANVSKTIIDLCTFFKKICARSVDVNDMYRAHDELVKILCNLELIYPPAFFDIMVHVVLHLPEEAILGGPVYMRWMYPFERYMKKLKAYVKNMARPEGSIAEGYVTEEALTFCSMYLEDIQTIFNRPDRNADGGIPKRQYSVFSSQCRPMSAKSFTNLCENARSSLGWFVLKNCDEIKSYLLEFKSTFPERNEKTEFSSWFYGKVSMSPDCTDELMALAHGPMSAYSYTACIVNGVRFVVHSRDLRHNTQNSGVLSFGEDATPFYGQLEEIIELSYLSNYSVVLFRCKWFNTSGKGRLIKEGNLVTIDVSRQSYVGCEWYDDQQYILATQAKQVFYLQDPSRTGDKWRVVEDVHHRKLWDYPSSSHVNVLDVLHDTQSSDYNLDVNSGVEGGDTSLDPPIVQVPVSHDTRTFGNLFIDLGYLPMVSTFGEGGNSSVNPQTMDDGSFIDDDPEDEGDPYSSDEELEMNSDEDNNNDNHVDTCYNSDDSN